MKEAFGTLKEILTSPSLFAFPNFDTHFILEMDASSVAIGAVKIKKN